MQKKNQYIKIIELNIYNLDDKEEKNINELNEIKPIEI